MFGSVFFKEKENVVIRGFSSVAVGEHFSQHTRHLPRSRIRQDAQPSDQAGLVHGPDLIENHLGLFPRKSDIHATGVVSPRRCHWRYYDRADVSVHLIRRDHYAWLHLLDFRSLRRIQVDQIYIISPNLLHHVQPLASNLFSSASGTSGASSPAAAIFSKATLQPSRTLRAGASMMTPFSTRISSSSPRPRCLITDEGMRIPFELPIRYQLNLHAVASLYNYIVITRKTDFEDSGLEVISL